MVLESCMILLDNSEYMRNGDYIPTRLEAQHDAANLLVGTKTQSNPESTVGVIAMTGEVDGAELLISPTDDMGKILTALHGVPIRSSSAAAAAGSKKSTTSERTDITAAIQVASLALKHRRNKNGSQRVVVFLGSPLASDARSLQKCGRQLKKNNIALDVVCLGELEENEPLAQELVNAANGVGDSGERTCHLVTVPPGVLPSDVLVGSPIVAGNAAAAMAAAAAIGGGGGGGGGEFSGASFAEYGGVDPNMDPELAMALRVSMEEERARQERLAAERAAAAAAEEESKTTEDQQPNTTTTAEQESAAAVGTTTRTEGAKGIETMEEDDDEDALLQQALAMSMQEHTAAAAAAAASGTEHQMMDMDDEEDADMQMALKMSMPGEEKEEDKGTSATTEDSAMQQQRFQDPDFVNQVLLKNI